MKRLLAFALGLTIGAVAIAVTLNKTESLGSGGGVSLWYVDSTYLRPVSTTWGLKIPSLTNCNTIDTDANGVFSCGTDATGAGGAGGISTSSVPVAGNLAYWTSGSALSDVATGTLTEGITGLEFSATRGLVGGAAALNLSTGYSMFLTASGTNWNSFYDTPSSRITDGTGLTWSSNTLNCDTASGSTQGCLTSADWTSFNGRVASTAIDTLAELETLQSGINIIQSTEIDTVGKLETFVGGQNILLETEIDASSELIALMDDETGTGLLTFATNPLLSGFRSSASSTIGGGTGASGLHINGGATSTSLVVTNGATATHMYASTLATTTSLFAKAFNFGASLLTLVTDTITASAQAIIDFGSAISFEIPNGTGPTVDAAGEIAVDTTQGELVWYDGVRKQSITGTTSPSFVLASTTKDAAGRSFNTATTSILLKNYPEPMTLTSFYCKASSTGSVLVRFGDGTNWTSTGSCSTTGTLYSATTNNTFTANEDFMVEVGSSATNPSTVTVTANLNRTAQ